jgi:hypothetical protein
MKKPLIPFGWMPGHWGLKGTTREIAKAEYELSGVDLDLRLAEIRFDPKAFAVERLAILRRYDLITVEEFEKQVTDLAEFDDPKKKDLARLDLDLKHKKITQDQYDRKKADILGEAWVSMPRIHWNPMGKNRAYFEMDYNEHFIKQLRDSGYEGDDTEIVNQWMNDVCIAVLEETNGMDVEYATPSRRSGGPDPTLE